MTPTALIIRTAGTNCDRELAHAFELAGSKAQTVHLNRLIESPALIDEADLIGFPGGFSYGDDIAAGRIFAYRLRRHLYDRLLAAAARGVPMIGICNGFQALVKMGLLPDPQSGEQAATLADNTCGRFIDRWVRLQSPPESVCVWTRRLGAIELPIAHGEGRFVAANTDLLARWKSSGQIALRYAHGDNPNGSIDDIAGVCDPSGLILGLMPHPERFTHPTHHPQWTGQHAGQIEPAGLRMFRAAVAHVSQSSARSRAARASQPTTG